MQDNFETNKKNSQYTKFASLPIHDEFMIHDSKTYSMFCNMNSVPINLMIE